MKNTGFKKLEKSIEHIQDVKQKKLFDNYIDGKKVI